MVDYRAPPYPLSYGSPVSLGPISPPPPPPPPPRQPTFTTQHPKLKPSTQIERDRANRLNPSPATSAATHTRSRTASSTALAGPLSTLIQAGPVPAPKLNVSSPGHQANMSQYRQFNRRTSSNVTDSTSTTTGNGLIPVRTSSLSDSLRRSTSSRSTGTQTGYVALIRKQKATVWCDRSQYEDPRLIAQQRAARIRADRAMVGSASPASTGGSGSFNASSLAARAKIRHHGRSVAPAGLTPASLVGGVGAMPLRLSHSEVGDEAVVHDDADSQHTYGGSRMVTHSGRSSLGSSRPNRASDGRGPPPHGSQYSVGPASGAGRHFSGNVTPSSGGSDGADDAAIMLHTQVQTPARISPRHQQSPQHQQQQQQQQQQHHHQQAHRGSVDYSTQSGGTGNSGGSSGEQEKDFGGLGHMHDPSTDSTSATRDNNRPSGLNERRRWESGVHRRDSVDDRSATMTTGIRLYVANPDPD